jgi:RNA polymerase sigma-70 factor (ECF subfamily)
LLIETMARPQVNPLVPALASGQLDAYAALFDRMSVPLLRAAGVMLGTTTEAEDVVQDVFVKIVRQRDRLLLVEDLDAYVFAMLRHAVARRIKRQQSERQRLMQWARVASDKKEPFIGDDLEAALRSLPAPQREVIALKIDGGLTFAQIAEILQVSPNTAASRYRYAIDKLRQILE